MRKIILLSNIVVILLLTTTQTFANTLEGLITDKSSHLPLIGVAVYFPDIRKGTNSDVNGKYHISGLPSIKTKVQISITGYKTIFTEVDLAHTSSLDFQMEEAVKELNTVVITGTFNAVEKNKTPEPISVISLEQIQQASSSNLIDALAKQPGISQITTGSGISKPVIRGLGFNRVVVVNDGIRQEGQQWGEEHGIEIDEYGVDRVEILKGPASLSYGSDAIAGVIQLLSAPPLQVGKQKATVLTEFQSNNGLAAIAGNYEFNSKGVSAGINLSKKLAHAYKNNMDGYVFNSGFSEDNIGLNTGISRHWGYSNFKINMYHLKAGIVDAERDSVTGKFTRELTVGDSLHSMTVSDEDLKSYQLHVPYQQIYHLKAIWSNNLLINQTSLKSTFGFQQNRRQEFSDPTQPSEYGLYLQLNTLNYDVRYDFNIQNKIRTTVGINGMLQNSLNKGSEFLIPDYSMLDGGIFFIAQRKFDKLNISGGLRADKRFLNVKSLYLNDEDEVSNPYETDADEKFAHFKKNLTGFSVSIGATYQLTNDFFTKLNFSKGYRSPNIAELSANGAHEGTFRYEIGNQFLKPENSYQVDFTLGLDSKHITTEIDLFANNIQNFIYLSKLNARNGGDSLRNSDGNSIPVYKYQSGKALLTGGEVTIDIHPHPIDNLHFETTFSYVNAQLLSEPDSMKYLPLTPPANLRMAVRYNIIKKIKYFDNLYFEAGIEKYFAQNNIFSAYNTETPTPAYMLVNASVGTDIKLKDKKSLSIYLNGLNLTDVAYQSHLSRLKYGPYNARNNTYGAYNMGRNYGIKLILHLL